jgi:hypothetical protein
MNKREKILTIGVILFVTVFIGRTVLNFFFLGPLKEKDAQIQAAQKEVDRSKAKRDTRNRLIRVWRNYDQKILDRDPNIAFLTLNARITNIINSSGLKEGVSVKPVPITIKRGTGVDLYWPIAVNLSARGTLDQIVKFMEMVYQEPYNLKITGLTIRPEGKDRILTISNCRIESIVPAEPELPNVTKSEHPEITSTQPAIKLLPDSQYAMITKGNIFMPGKPAGVIPPPSPPVAVKPQPPVAGPPQAPGVPGQGTAQSMPATPGRPGDVVGTFVVGSVSGAYVRNQTSVQWYKVGERLTNNMELAFVHPLGIVFLDPSGQVKYTEIGRNIDQAHPLSSQAIPELYDAYKSAKSSTKSADDKN